MYCRKCGEKILDDSLFCAKCGSKVGKLEDVDTSNTKSAETKQAQDNADSQKKPIDVKKENDDNSNNSSVVLCNNTSITSHEESRIENNTTINKWISNKYVKYGIIAAAILLLIIVTVAITKKFSSHNETTIENSTIINDEKTESAENKHKGKWWPDGMYVYDGGPGGRIVAFEFAAPDILYIIHENGDETLYKYKFVGDQMLIKDESKGEGWDPIMFEYDDESQTLINTDMYYDKIYYKYTGEGRDRSGDGSNSALSSEVPEFNPFDGVDVEFKGMSGAATATISGDLQGLKASVEPKSGLKNGDKVRVTIDASNLDIYVAQHNKKPNPLEKEYTVEGLGSYVLENTSFTKEYINTINISGKEQAEKYIADCCKASSKNSFLINQADKVLLTWETAGKATSDPKLLRIDAGTNNDGSGNMMLLLYEVPYEAFVKKDGSGRNEDGKVIGSGSAYVVIIYKNATVYGDSNDSVGQYENHGIRETKEELFNVKEKYKDQYKFISVDVEDKSSDVDSTIDDSAWKEAFKKTLSDTAKKEKVVCYYIYDIDKDKIPELIIKIGEYEANYQGLIYKYDKDKGEATEIGNIAMGDSSLYTYPEGNGMIQDIASMGEQTIDRVYIENGKVEDEMLSYAYHDDTEYEIQYTDIKEYIKGSEELKEYKSDDLEGITGF